MNLQHKIALMAGTAVLVGSLAGVALAAGETAAGSASESAEATSDAPATSTRGDLDQAVREGRLTQAQADLLTQIRSLREEAMQELRAEIAALIDQAVADGTITQEQADQMLHDRGPGRLSGKGGHRLGSGRLGRDGCGMGGFWGLTEDELKARLDAAVEAGRLTQEKADGILQRFTDRQAESSAVEQSE